MQIALVLLFAVVSGQDYALHSQQWATALISRLDKTHPSALNINAVGPPEERGKAQPIVVGNREGTRKATIDPVLIAQGRLAEKVERYAIFLVRQNEPQKARSYLSEVFAQRPELRTLEFGDTPIDIGLRLMDTGATYPLLRRIIMSPGADSEEMYLRLSLLGALEGVTVRGQDEYCRKYLANNIGANQLKSYIPPPKAGDAKALRLLSCLALGIKNKPCFDELALSIDPRCQLAAYRLIEYYGDKHRYSDLRRIAFTYVAKSPPSLERDKVLKRAASLEGVPDSPIDPIVPKPLLGADPPR